MSKHNEEQKGEQALHKVQRDLNRNTQHMHAWIEHMQQKAMSEDDQTHKEMEHRQTTEEVQDNDMPNSLDQQE